MTPKTITEQFKDYDERFNGHLFQQVQLLTEAKEKILSLTPSEIENWLNTTPPAELSAMLTEHATKGAATNALCVACGVAWRVDVEAFIASASKRGLAITQDATGWHVAAITTEPLPE